jgi:Lysozyme like domain
LRALLVGLFALCLVTQATAATMQGGTTQAPRKTKVEQSALTLDERLERKVAALRKYRGTIQFYENRRSLLSSGDRRIQAKTSLAYARQRVRELTKTVAALRAKVRAQTSRKLASLPPRAAICGVFGSYCQEAVAVAWCESRLSTTAQNGQYLGLFQMGSYARQLFGHGDTARDQAVAAHRYFVRSGRDWSPWSCRWAAS